VSIDPTKLLAQIPTGLATPLLETYRDIASNFAEHRWEPSELNGGKFCECVYWICHGFLTGAYRAKPSKPQNMLADSRALESFKDTGRPGDRSLRILIPRMLPALYEIRNNRGVGHVGGDVDPNVMDATQVYSSASWILAELIRVFHNSTTTAAQEAVDALVERKTPLVWSPGTAKRVLATNLSVAHQTLLLLHQALGWMSETELVMATEYSNTSVYRSKVLMKLHKERLVEFDRVGKRARISPKGSHLVEEKIIMPHMANK
jgi:hypothetical protein